MLDDAALTALLDLGFEFGCQKRISDLIDVGRVLEAIDLAATPERLLRLHQRVIAPQRDRLLARAKASDVELGAWIPEMAVEPIADLIGAPVPLPPKMVDDMVASEQVRDEVRAMLSDTLSGFLKKAFGGDSTGGAASIGSMLGRGARTFGALGKGLLGGLGDELQKQLQDKVRDFVDGSVSALQERIAKKLKSEETAKALAKRRRAGFLKLLKKKESEAVAPLGGVPFPAIDALVPLLLHHNLGRAELRAAVKDEIAAVLGELSTQTIGDWLEELGLRAHAKSMMHAALVPIVREVVATEPFLAWWKAHATHG